MIRVVYLQMCVVITSLLFKDQRINKIYTFIVITLLVGATCASFDHEYQGYETLFYTMISLLAIGSFLVLYFLLALIKCISDEREEQA